jgi:hypothetical protein
MYAAGNDWRKVDVGVTGERNDRVNWIDSLPEAPRLYVRLVVDASNEAPSYVGSVTV